MDERSEWISLGEAARVLGVHPATVRNWADRGELPFRRTPGGHRRFRRSDLVQWVASRNSTQPVEARVIVQSALGRIHMQLGGGQLEDYGWYRRLGEKARRALADLGRRTMDALMRHLSGDQLPAGATPQALGRDYGRILIGTDLQLTDSVQVFFFFNDFLIDSIIQMSEANTSRPPSEWGEFVRKVNAFTTQILLSVIRVYQEAGKAPRNYSGDPPGALRRSGAA